MKKVYEKPQIYMERFELSQSIASCYYNYDNSFNTPSTCAATELGYGYVVFQGADGCTVINEDYCYEPSTGGNTFNS